MAMPFAESSSAPTVVPAEWWSGYCAIYNTGVTIIGTTKRHPLPAKRKPLSRNDPKATGP